MTSGLSMSLASLSMSRPSSLGDRERLGLADRSVGREELRVEGPELVARQLIARGARHLRRLDRPRPEHRIILEDELQVRIVLHELRDVRKRALAIVAIVIEELDQRRGALRVAEGRLILRAEQGARLRGDHLLALRVGRFLVVLVERLDRLAQHVGIVDEIFLDEGAEFLLLRRRKPIALAGAPSSCFCAVNSSALAGAAVKAVPRTMAARPKAVTSFIQILQAAAWLKGAA